MPYAPWYCPWASAGASPKEIPQPAAECHSSPVTCTNAPASSSAHRARRSARAAGGEEHAGERDGHARPAGGPGGAGQVLGAARGAHLEEHHQHGVDQHQAEIIQAGPGVAGDPQRQGDVEQAKCMDISPSSTVKARNGRSRRATSRGPCVGAATGATGGQPEEDHRRGQ